MNTTRSNAPAPSTLVIGAGLAGLTAARSLAAKGRDVLVLESRDRVGGRVHPVTVGGQCADLGAEFIHPGDQALTALAAEIGVKISGPALGATNGVVHGCLPVVDGRLLSPEEIARVDAEIRSALRDHPPAEHEITSQWIRRAGVSAAARAVTSAIAHQHTCAEPHHHHARQLAQPPREVRRFIGGTHLLTEALARDLDIRLETPVTVIRQSGGRVVVETSGGRTWTTDHVVMAVPALTVANTGFSPSLPESQLRTLASLPHAEGGTIVVQFAEGDAVRAALSTPLISDGPVSALWLADPGQDVGPATVRGVIRRAHLHLLKTPDVAADAVAALVEVAAGGPATRLSDTSHDWGTDPHARGLGAVIATSHLDAVVASLATPHRRVHFAGDHTDAVAPGTMEGAVRSGRRAAAEVLRTPRRVDASHVSAKLVRP